MILYNLAIGCYDRVDLYDWFSLTAVLERRGKGPVRQDCLASHSVREPAQTMSLARNNGGQSIWGNEMGYGAVETRLRVMLCDVEPIGRN